MVAIVGLAVFALPLGRFDTYAKHAPVAAPDASLRMHATAAAAWFVALLLLIVTGMCVVFAAKRSTEHEACLFRRLILVVPLLLHFSGCWVMTASVAYRRIPGPHAAGQYVWEAPVVPLAMLIDNPSFWPCIGPIVAVGPFSAGLALAKPWVLYAGILALLAHLAMAAYWFWSIGILYIN